jgi:2-polyprenyl-6-methoxyphenol hydroxylase-like FAD-dependent oxidoreductase
MGLRCSSLLYKRAGAVIHRWLFRDIEGEALCVIDLKTTREGVGHFVDIARMALHEILLVGAAVPRHLGAAVTSATQEGERVAGGFGDGTSGGYDALIGADGIASSVRRLVLGADPPRYGGQMVWRRLAPFRPKDSDAVQFWLGDGCFFGLCPVGGGLTYGFGNATVPRLLLGQDRRAEGARRGAGRACSAPRPTFVSHELPPPSRRRRSPAPGRSPCSARRSLALPLPTGQFLRDAAWTV